MRRLAVSSLVAVVVALATHALAHADAGDLNLSIAPTYATTSAAGISRVGVGAAADAEYGLSDSLWLRGTLFGSAHKYPFEHEGNYFGGAEGGVTYALDYLRIIPFADLGVAVVYSAGPAGQGVGIGGELGLGFDDLESRTFSWGIIARYHYLLTTPPQVPNLSAIPAYFYVGPRFTFRFPD
jgi:hypothetical protein